LQTLEAIRKNVGRNALRRKRELAAGVLAVWQVAQISTAPMATLPLLLIPAFLVPLFLMLHTVALMQSRELIRRRID
jgi:hypothetical protein